MKKFLKALTAVFAVVILTVTLVGCTANVSGKTYAFSEVVANLPEDASEAEKTLVNGVKPAVEAVFKNVTLTFNEDGTVKDTLSKWSQDGKTVTVTTGDTTTAIYTVNGKKLERSYEQSGYKFTIVYEQK